MRNILKDNSALAFSIFFMFLMVVFISILWIILIDPVNEITNSLNSFVGKDMVSQQSFESYEFTWNIFRAIPLYAVIAIMLWGIIRALEKSQGGEL